METNNVEKVMTVFKGIGERNADHATKYINPKKYIEHNPFAADGANGLKDYIDSFPPANHHLKVVRVFQDGSFVFTQEDGEILGENTFFDVFRFEDGLIVEHWIFSAKAAPPNKSGHMQTDGPTKTNQHQHTEKNKVIVRDYYETVHIRGNHENIREYFSEEVCIRHEPGVSDGVSALLQDLGIVMLHRSIDKIKLLLGEGDFVFIAALGTVEEAPCLYIDLYRVECEKIVEHWGFPEKIPLQEEWKNKNGVL